MKTDNTFIANLRANYLAATLSTKDVDKNPFAQFKKWIDEALKADLHQPNTMTLATASKDGKPSARIVLLKDFDEAGFVFYTNFQSKKGQELLENPQAALVFLWLELQRQLRIEGHVEKVSTEKARNYFRSRPKDSQISAYASPQSDVVENRGVLEENVKALEEKYADQAELPLPDFWGGFRIVPTFIEFWQGRPSRLHDRIAYQKQEDGSWKIERLAP